MHSRNPAAWQHEHRFDQGNLAGERGTRAVMWLTAATMVVEIVAGWYFNSMALLADGLHMSSHAFAIGLSAFAYAAARRYANDRRFAFGTWKIEILGGFASAIFLLFIVLLMAYGSIERLFSPQPIRYLEAIVIAAGGLAVNIASALILGAAHHHGHDHHHDHHEHGDPQHPGDEAHAHYHGHSQADLNLRSAYVHVITDAATSVLALVALAGGWFFGWSWLDPAMGIVGALVVAIWARRLLADTAKVLLDREMDHPVVGQIRKVIESSGAAHEARVVDLHVWRVGRSAYACAVVVVTHDPELTPARVREWLAPVREVAHATIEVEACPDEAPSACGPAPAQLRRGG